MSQAEREFFDKYAKGQNTTSQTVGNTTVYTTESKIVGGQTVTSPSYQTATYTTTQPIVTGSYVNGNTSVYQGQTSYSQIPQDYKLVNQTFQTTTGYSGLGQSLTQKVVAEEIPVESRIEYIPFEKKYIEYDQIERIERIPYEREIVEYEEVTRTERIPIERTITDYYAVETQIEYIPKEIEETIVEYEPVERVWQRVQYLPVQTQIVHYPQRDNYVAGQSQYIKAGYVEGGYTTNTTYVPSQSGVRTETVYQTGYAPVSSSVVQGSGVRGGLVQGTTQYVTGPTYTQTYTTGPVYGQTYTSGGQTYTSGGQTYTSGGQTYTSGPSFVTGGSGVRGETVYRQSQTGGYVTGGSGVRQQ